MNEVKLYGQEGMFRAVGKANIGGRSLENPKFSERSNWSYVNSSFGVDIDDKGNSIYVRLEGGYRKENNPIIRRLPRERGDEFRMVEIPYEERFEPHNIERVAYNEIITVQLDGEPKKEFVLAHDALKYLQDNLKQGDDIVVMGKVTYSNIRPFSEEGQTYRNYVVNRIYANRRNEDGELENKPEATMRQRYLVSSYSLEDGWKNTIKRGGSANASVHVPTYINQVRDDDGKYVDYKRVAPLPQSLTIRMPENIKEENYDAYIRLVENTLGVRSDDELWQVYLNVDINEGYTQEQGEVKVTPEVQDLIDIGVYTLEEIQSQVTTRGQRVRELIFKSPIFKEEDGRTVPDIDKESYKATQLAVPTLAGEQAYKDVFEEDKPKQDTNTDTDFDTLFS